MKKVFCLLIATLMLAGCSTRITDFTMITSKNIDISRMPTFQRDSKRVEGEDTTHIIIFIPTGVPNAKEALDRAIESVPGAVALLDGVMTHKWFYIPYIYGRSWYIVEGTALIDPQLLTKNNQNEKNSKYNLVFFDKIGKLEQVKPVSRDEFERVKKGNI